MNVFAYQPLYHPLKPIRPRHDLEYGRKGPLRHQTRSSKLRIDWILPQWRPRKENEDRASR